jgi:hypothetical protein
VATPPITVDAAVPIDGGPVVIIDGGPLPFDSGPIDVIDWMDQYLRELYDTTVLLDGYEAYVGNAAGNAQPCFGDSGGPLARMVNGELTAFGVTSGGIDSPQLICDYGAVYATFGPDVATFIKTALTWKDPCAGVSRLGICQRNTSQRCSYANEGKRRLLVVECALLGQTCVIASDGEALCAYPGEDPLATGTGGTSGAGGNTGAGGSTGRVDAGRAAGSALSLADAKALLDAMVKKAQQGYRPPFARR